MERPERLARWDQMERPAVVPSLLNCDFARMNEVFDDLREGGTVAVHLDVMDGRFVPNFTYGPPLVADWRRAAGGLVFDAHLMMDDPESCLDAFAAAGCDLVTVHIEVVPVPSELFAKVRSLGMRAGIALNPGTPVGTIVPFLDEADAALVMTVEPGRGGQALLPEALEKASWLRDKFPKLWISVDGGINAETARSAALTGASQLVVGSAAFRNGTRPSEAINAIARIASP